MIIDNSWLVQESVGNMKESEELMQCMKCGEWLPRSKLELMKTGTRRRVCNHCKWVYYVKPSRERAILRELDQKHSFRPPKP